MYSVKTHAAGTKTTCPAPERSEWCMTGNGQSRQKRAGKIHLINMDCEGSELLVLKGAEKTLRRNKVEIFCEIHHDFLNRLGQSIRDITKYLKGLNFKAHTVSLDDLSMGDNFGNCEYIYAHK